MTTFKETFNQPPGTVHATGRISDHRQASSGHIQASKAQSIDRSSFFKTSLIPPRRSRRSRRHHRPRPRPGGKGPFLRIVVDVLVRLIEVERVVLLM